MGPACSGNTSELNTSDQGRETSVEEREPSLVTCPVCGEKRESGGRYCESCGTELDNRGTDFENRGVPPVATSSRAVAESRSPPFDWELVVDCDRDYFERMEAEDIEFPAVPVERTFTLTRDRVAIGRECTVQPGEQAVDLAAPPVDAGVSRRHALLARQPDGGWAVVDCHSTNGTYVNDGYQPISCEEPIPVVDGDQIHLGAWTTITLRSVRRHSTVRPLPAESSGAGNRRR
jgi:FHA domain